MATINLDGFGHCEAEAVTGAKTLDAGDCGIVQNVTATATVTLPATAALRNFLIRVGAEGITVTIAPNSSDYIIGNGSTATTTNKALVFTAQPAGSYVQLTSGTGGWVTTRILGTAVLAA
jgi:hypothetical protein